MLYDCTLIQNISLPSTLKAIGDHNFEAMANLTTIEINSAEIYQNPGEIVSLGATIRVLASIDDGTSEAFNGLVKRVDGDYNIYTRA